MLQPNGKPECDTKYQYFDDGTILRTITIKQLFAGLPTKSVKKEEQTQRFRSLAKKTQQNMAKAQAQGAMDSSLDLDTDFVDRQRKADLARQQELLRIGDINHNATKAQERGAKARIAEQTEQVARQMEQSPRFGKAKADEFRTKNGLPTRAEQEALARQAEANTSIDDMLNRIRMGY